MERETDYCVHCSQTDGFTIERPLALVRSLGHGGQRKRCHTCQTIHLGSIVLSGRRKPTNLELRGTHYREVNQKPSELLITLCHSLGKLGRLLLNFTPIIQIVTDQNPTR